ncbi:MAG: GAF domain-containing sensor histidine kinase [Anaerolineae bacterium]
MLPLVGTALLASLMAHALLLIYQYAQNERVRSVRWSLMLAVLFSLLTSAANLVPAFSVYPPVLFQAALIIAYGALVIGDVNQRVPRAWLIGGGIWLAAVTAGAVFDSPHNIGADDWLALSANNPTLLTTLLLGGMLILSLILIGTVFYAFYKAALPEVANRALFWVIDTAALLISVVLVISSTQILLLLGQVLAFVSLLGATYALFSYRVVDIRNQMNTAIRASVFVLVTAVVIYAALAVADSFDARTPLILAALAILAAVIHTPLRQLAEAIVDLLQYGSLVGPTEITRRYNQAISSAVELPALVDSATRSINSLLRVRRSALILVSESDDATIRLTMLPGDDKSGVLAKDGLLYRELTTEEDCISQFDLQFSPKYKAAPQTETAFFRSTQMSAYAPIRYENNLIGILACGAKISDSTFNKRDFELQAILAHQTGAALRNARLVADLRLLNDSVEDAKERIERLDSVKTDFITIASHELNTPLAQIRGYTEILDTLNEQGVLDDEQIASMIGSLRKAGERMEELIGAMLDVSQLNVNAMDLRFEETTLDAVVRVAIEPLTDAIKQRKLSLAARGLRDLPAIHADTARLVQAFRNVVVNAIKYTPDGGRIEIKASVQTNDRILVTITDSGVGIERENLELIFHKFYRASDPNLHSTGAYKFMGAGPGLGLTIAQGVIEGHGGKIWAESAGHSMETFPGATFCILLPITPPEDARRVRPFRTPETTAQTLVHTTPTSEPSQGA